MFYLNLLLNGNSIKIKIKCILKNIDISFLLSFFFNFSFNLTSNKQIHNKSLLVLR